MKKMKNKKGEPIKIITLRTNEKLRDRIDKAIDSKDAHISRNMWIIQIIEKELKKLEKKS